MYLFIDKILLLVCCLFSLFRTAPTSAYLIAFLGALSVSMLLYVQNQPRIGAIFLTFSFCAAFVLPETVLFFPLLIYDLPGLFSAAAPDKRSRMFCFFPAAIAFIALLREYVLQKDPHFFFFLCCGCGLALYLRIRTDRYEVLHQRFLKTRDDDTELQLLLKEKNRSLLENQDYQIYTATLRERNRIAREIHDNVGHMLTRSILMTGALKAINRHAELSSSLEQLEETLNQAMNSIRESVHDLHDSSVNLKASLETLVHDFSFCPVTLQYGISPEIPKEISLSFISIVKEALVNISRHSNADHAWITAQEHPAFYQLIIRDNGTKASLPSQETHSGIGLSNISTRVESLKGVLHIQTEAGFCIYITIPKGDSQ